MALDFDGVDDKVDHGDIAGIDGASALTSMAWIKYDTAVAGGDPFIGKAALVPMYSSGASGLKMTAGEAAVWEKSTTADSITVGTWEHWAIVYDGSQAAADRIVIYKNGSSQAVSGTNPGATLVDTGTAVVTIGTDTAIGTFIDGKIGHVRLWAAALSSAEVNTEMGMDHAVRTSNLLLDAPYNPDGTDVSGNGNNGTISGAVFIAGPDTLSGQITAASGVYTITGTAAGLVRTPRAGHIYRADTGTTFDNETITSYVTLPWQQAPNPQTHDKVVQWLDLTAYLKGTATVNVDARFADEPHEFATATFTTYGTIGATPDGDKGFVYLGVTSRWMQVRLRATSLSFEIQPPVVIGYNPTGRRV